MWFLFALITVFAWGGADLFYKKGADESDRYSHLKTSAAVGLMMGVFALSTILFGKVSYDFRNLLIYFPVSLMYILSMTVGYFGLKYLELSVSSPIQNASGAVSCLLLVIVLRKMPDLWSLAAIVLISVGVFLLGVFEKRREDEYFEKTNQKYKIGIAAFFMPIIYCLIDSLGTFLDGYYLDDIEKTPLVGVTEETFEDVANISYELTFFACAIVILFYLIVVRKQPLFRNEKGESYTPARFIAAGLECAGQYTYVYAMSGNGIAAAPMIASYCVAAVVLARIFLKEKLSWRQYLAVLLVTAGIAILGVTEGA